MLDGHDEGRPVPIEMEIGRRLRRIRLHLGLSLADVQQLSGGTIGAGTLGMYERGDRTINVARLASVAAFYAIPVGALVPGAPDVSLVSTSVGEVLLQRLRGIEALRIHLSCLADSSDGRVQQLVAFTQGILRERRVRHHRGDVYLRRSDLLPVLILFGASPTEAFANLRNAGLARGDERTLRLCQCV